MKSSKTMFLVFFLIFIPTVYGLEYDQYKEPMYSIENESIINNIKFCFNYEDEIFCRPVSDFKDDIRGVTCDYTMFVRSVDVIHYQFRCELNKSKKICPLVLNLGDWPQKIVRADFEININEDSVLIDKFPFILSGKNHNLYVPSNLGYDYRLYKLNENFILEICSQKQKNIHEASIEVVAVPIELNKTNFHNIYSIKLYENPPTYSFGPEETIGNIEIDEFFTGQLFKWDPYLPYAKIAVEIFPENETYDKNETLLIKFESISIMETLQIPYIIDQKKWIFPESGTVQVDFEYTTWFFPMTKYTSNIIVENNISLSGNQSLKIPNNIFLDGFVIFDKNRINIEIFHNQTFYFILILILIFYGVPLIYSFYKINSGTRINTPVYFFQLIPICFILFWQIIPPISFLFIILLLSYLIFWMYYFYKKYYKKQKNN